MLARGGRQARRLQMNVVRRGVDDRVDAPIFEDRLVAWRRSAAVLGRERLSLRFGAGVARRDGEFPRSDDRVRQHIGPPPHPDAGNGHRHECHS